MRWCSMKTPRRGVDRGAAGLALAGLAARLREPSSWAAIAAAMAAIGISVPAEVWQPIVHTGAGVAALAGFFLKENGK